MRGARVRVVRLIRGAGTRHASSGVVRAAKKSLWAESRAFRLCFCWLTGHHGCCHPAHLYARLGFTACLCLTLIFVLIVLRALVLGTCFFFFLQEHDGRHTLPGQKKARGGARTKNDPLSPRLSWARDTPFSALHKPPPTMRGRAGTRAPRSHTARRHVARVSVGWAANSVPAWPSPQFCGDGKRLHCRPHAGRGGCEGAPHTRTPAFSCVDG